MWRGGFPPHHSWATSGVSCSSPQLGHCLPRDSDQGPQVQVSAPQGLLKPVTSPTCHFMLVTNTPQTGMRRHAGRRPEQRSFCPCGVWGLAWASNCSGSPSGSCPNPSFWIFTEASLHRHDWLTHWLLAVQLPAPLPSLELGCGGEDWKFQLCNHRVWSPGNQSPHP